jgi:hypothetical protein
VFTALCSGPRSVSIVVQPTSAYHSIYNDCLCHQPRIRLSSSSSSSVSDSFRLSSAAVSRNASSVTDCHQYCTDGRCSRQCCIVSEPVDKLFTNDGELDDGSSSVSISTINDQYTSSAEDHHISSTSDYRIKPVECQINILNAGDEQCSQLMVSFFDIVLYSACRVDI